MNKYLLAIVIAIAIGLALALVSESSALVVDCNNSWRIECWF